MYIDFTDYSEIYNDLVEKDFAFYCFKACLELDKQTTGVDGYAKLEKAYPTDEKAAMAVKICAVELVHMLAQIDNAAKATGYEANGDGKFVGKQISSVSSGSESMSFSSGSSVYESCVNDPNAKRLHINALIKEYLSGITDANGVNLLFMGEYPYVYKHDNFI